jgi:hypothetical protein
VDGVGYVKKWVVDNRRKTHWLDCGYRAIYAAHYCGVRNLPRPQATPTRRPYGMVRPGNHLTQTNQPFLISDRS